MTPERFVFTRLVLMNFFTKALLRSINKSISVLVFPEFDFPYKTITDLISF